MSTIEKEKWKSIRKEAGYIGWGLSVYTIIVSCVTALPLFFTTIQFILSNPGATNQDRVFRQMIEKSGESGIPSIVGVCFGMLFFVLFLRKRKIVSSIMHKGKDMKGISFLQILGVFLGVQTFSSILSCLLERGLNLFGVSSLQDVEIATSVSTTATIFLYASVVVPIVEEIIYRGFVLRSLEKYGKTLAIVVSSILFGVMHANISQAFVAFGLGLVLGYVAIEYSFKWAVILHFINNCLFSDVLGWFLSGLSVSMQETVNTVLLVLYGGAAVLILVIKRRRIKKYLIDNRTPKGVYFCIFTSVGMLVFVIGEIIYTFHMLEK